MSNPFFSNHGPFKITDILQTLKLKSEEMYVNQIINDIKDLMTSNTNDITFFHTKKYKDLANNTKASFCITSESLKSELPTNCIPLIVENILVVEVGHFLLVQELLDLGIEQTQIHFIDGEYCSWHGVRMIQSIQYLQSWKGEHLY